MTLQQNLPKSTVYLGLADGWHQNRRLIPVLAHYRSSGWCKYCLSKSTIHDGFNVKSVTNGAVLLCVIGVPLKGALTKFKLILLEWLL